MNNWVTQIIRVALIILFLGCLLPMEYEYFQFIRIVGMISFGVLAFDAYSKKEKYWLIIWLLSAIAINPIIKIPLGRFYWNIVDVIWSLLLLISIFISAKKINLSVLNDNMKESDSDGDKKLKKFLAKEFLLFLFVMIYTIAAFFIIDYIEKGFFNYYFDELNLFKSNNLYRVVNSYTFWSAIIIVYILRPLYYSILWSIKTLKE